MKVFLTSVTFLSLPAACNSNRLQTYTRWPDYGPDEYISVTWANIGERKVFLSWMSNWQYANVVPTERWRSAMTVRRNLGVEKVEGKYYVTSKPVDELKVIDEKGLNLENITAENYNLTDKAGKPDGTARLTIAAEKLDDFTIILSNKNKEKVLMDCDKKANKYFIDRTKSGKVDFKKGFAKRHTAVRMFQKTHLDLSIIIDNASVE